MLELELHGRNEVRVSDASSRDMLRNGFYGVQEKGKTALSIYEALYLLDVRNAACKRGKKDVSFAELASKFANSPRFIARYFTYKDWRDRGLVAVSTQQPYSEPNQTPVKKYPISSLSLPAQRMRGVFFSTDLTTMLEDDEAGRKLYESLWFGQYGSYKAADRGKLNKLDVFEALFLMENKRLELSNSTAGALEKRATSRRQDFPSLYGVYRDWREKGYVVKTGFKFGTHFRIYFPGARPMKAGASEWSHSKHVLHVFPKNSKLLISEWARAIRVAHSVRKTFILAVPGTVSDSVQDADFVLYHRHGGEADNPENASPKYAMLSLSEEEYIGGQELSGAINWAKKHRLELLLAIADRETAVTYYRVIQIKLQGSRHDYFEIDWLQP